MNAPLTNEQQNGKWPAFPGQARDAQGAPIAEYADGLTKRELFAAMAMQGIVSHIGPNAIEGYEKEFSACACRCADALLSALKETQP